jgi:hypothetical protein
MESRFWRTLAANIAIGTVIEYGICLAISWYFNDRNQYFYALLIMLAFWAVQFGIWVKSQAVGLIFYYLTGKQQFMARIESQLRHYKMPLLDDFAAPDATSYLTRIAEDKESNLDQVRLAAGTLGGIQMLREIKPTMAWKMMSVLEAALENYRRRASVGLHRAGGVADGNQEYLGSGLTAATDDLSEEESNRQSGLLHQIMGKSRRASFIAWSALTAKQDEDLRETEWGKYFKMRDEALLLVSHLTDEFYRDTAANFLVEMLTIAGETDRAQQLIDHMTVDFIKEKAMEDFNSGAEALYAKLHNRAGSEEQNQTT